MSLLSPLCALDIGSQTSRLCMVDTGAMLTAPSIIVPEEGVRSGPASLPLVERGRITDDIQMGSLIRHMLLSGVKSPLSFARPRLALAVPCSFTPVEKQAFIHAAFAGGAGSVQLVSTALSAAYGSGVDFRNPRATILLSCGEAFSEFSVLISGAQMYGEELSCTSQELSSVIAKEIKKKLGVVVPLPAIQHLISIHPVLLESKDASLPGKVLATGKFGEVNVPHALIKEVATAFFTSVAHDVERHLRSLDPALASDVVEQGMLLYGGLSSLSSLPLLFSSLLRIPVSTVPEPETCVITGLRDLAPSISFYENDEENEEDQVLGCM